MDRYTAMILEWIFLFVTAAFFALWIFLVGAPVIQDETIEFVDKLPKLFLNVFFFLTLAFGIVCYVFHRLKKSAAE